MTWLEAERNSYELGRTEKDRRLALHYQDLFDALYNNDTEILETFFDRDEYAK